MPPPQDPRDLEAAIGLLRDVIASRSISPDIFESLMGWPEGELTEWLEKPYEARLADYLRLLRLATSQDLGRSERGGEEDRPEEPDLLASFLHVSPYRDAASGVKSESVHEIGWKEPVDTQPLRLFDLIFTALLPQIIAGQMTRTEMIESLRFYLRLVESLPRGVEPRGSR